jgi:hypothetical protein
VRAYAYGASGWRTRGGGGAKKREVGARIETQFDPLLARPSPVPPVPPPPAPPCLAAAPGHRLKLVVLPEFT